MNVIILGNGFDLHHKLPTSFSDFRLHLMQDSKNNELVKEVDSIVRSYVSSLEIDPQKINVDHNCFNLDWSTYEEAIYKYSLTYFSGTSLVPSKKKDYEKLIAIHNKFCSALYTYLININVMHLKVNSKIDSYFKCADLILTFNYTDTYKIYSMKSSCKIVHLHGSLDTDKLYWPIVGYSILPLNSRKSNSHGEDHWYDSKKLDKVAQGYINSNLTIENVIDKELKEYFGKIKNVTSIGFSFGNSDSHVSKILSSLLVEGFDKSSIHYGIIDSIQKLEVNFFKYNLNDRDLISSYFNELFRTTNRKTETEIIGDFFNGYEHPTLKLISINEIDYL